MNTNIADISWELVAPIIVLNLILVAVALIDYVKRSRARGAHWLWIPLILFVSIIGPVTYFVFGRRS